MIQALIPILAPLLGDVIRSKFPDPTEAAKIESELALKMYENSARIESAAADIIKAEAQSQHVLAATWRPIVMLVFTGLIVARWFGWAAPGMSEAEVLKLWSIVEFGLGGYVVGRSIEKIAPSVAQVFKK
jgi:hypothetical protein